MSQEELDQILDKLNERICSGPNADFSEKEIVALRRVLKTFEMLESWGKLGRFLIWAAMTVAGLAIAWSQVKETYTQ